MSLLSFRDITFTSWYFLISMCVFNAYFNSVDEKLIKLQMLSIRATMIIHERDEIISALTNLSTHVQILILLDKVTATSVNLQVTCSDMIFVDVPECYIHNLQNAQISHISICDFIQAFAVTAAFEFPVVPLVSCSPSILTLMSWAWFFSVNQFRLFSTTPSDFEIT